jgi:hypothetical protein
MQKISRLILLRRYYRHYLGALDHWRESTKTKMRVLLKDWPTQ